MERKIYVALLLLCYIVIIPLTSMGQKDSYFYNNYDNMNRDGNAAVSFDNFSFGNGMGFDFLNTNPNGYNFENFSNDGNGIGFGNFDLYNEVPLGSGLFLLTAMTIFYTKRKSNKNYKK